MAEVHKWKISVEAGGFTKRFRHPDGAKNYFEFTGTLNETLMKVKKYILNEREERNKLERDMGESS